MGEIQLSHRVPHPLEQLSIEEANRARDVVLQKHERTVIDFRTVSLEEPPKAQLQPYLDAENAGTLSSTPRPARQARIAYDVVSENKRFDFYESVVDVSSGEVVSQELIDQSLHAPLTLTEFDHLVKAVWDSKLFQDALTEFQLPEGFNVVVEPWPYGGRASDDENKRYFQGLCFAQDTRSGNPDSNFYAFPLPLIPIMDARKKEIIRVERLATGGKEDGLLKGTHVKEILKHCKPAEYVPELLENGTRKDLKPLNVIQPDGASFTVTDESLVEWQKWRFRVGFNSREGATIHDVRYNGRSVAYRIGISEMTVPYADARAPMHRKQAFDFGDGGAGSCANNLSLGCDCLGNIKYFNSTNMTGDGTVSVHQNVICLHEQDNGIGWKHTNWRTGRAVVTRYRELVVQFIITLANYEYVFSYHFDQAGAIMIETRATGIVSCVNIDPGKTSEYGNVVANGVLAQNHQHIFAVRLDPAIDGVNNTAVIEESHPVPTSEERNPRGNFYEVRQTQITKSSGHDAAPQHNRLIRLINPNKKNPISGKPVSYKFTPPPTQKLLAQPGSVQERRAQFCRHHVWITKYKDHELYAGGRYTLQSSDEIDGVSDAAKRNDNVENTDIVLWSCFGLTHNPRVEDWPVMPVEIFQLHFKPSDFFTENPALDVPSDKNLTSKLHDEKSEGDVVMRNEKKGDMVACCKL